MIPPSLIRQLINITLCGNLGDPLLNNDLIPIVEYLAKHNPNLGIDIHTNGSLRNIAWWKKLAKSLPSGGLVQFGIDGLEDTHHLYRIGTDFKKIIANARAFISEGGRARWNYITFKHNEHQLEAARKLSNELGFESFQEKQTSRFIGNPYFEVYNKDGKITHILEQPTEQKLVFIDKKTVENYKELIKTATIDCEAEKTKSIYIDAQGYLWPCCFVGAVPYIHTTPEQLVHTFQTDSYNTFQEVLNRFGGVEQFNLRNRKIEDIINSVEWQTIWNDVFKENSLRVCARTCGKFPEVKISQCRDQFIELENFNE
jgi:MoaA/NifB/PqqE/SkfB family radical SAM enzyme